MGALQSLNDPRLAIWAKKVEIPIVIDPTLPPITDNVRYFGTAASALLQTQQIAPVNTDPNYVGLPPGIQSPSTYNANPIVGQASYNPHVSYLNEMYMQPSTAKAPLLKARLALAAEVQFIIESELMKYIVKKSSLKYEVDAGDRVVAQVNLLNIGTAQILTIPGEVLPYIGYYLKRKMRTSVTSLGENTAEIYITEALKLVAESLRADGNP